MALHQRADVVVGVHGAGLANVLWARRGCHVVEIVPVDVHLDFQCGLTPFWHVAELLGLRKHAFIAYEGRMFEPRTAADGVYRLKGTPYLQVRGVLQLRSA